MRAFIAFALFGSMAFAATIPNRDGGEDLWDGIYRMEDLSRDAPDLRQEKHDWSGEVRDSSVEVRASGEVREALNPDSRADAVQKVLKL